MEGKGLSLLKKTNFMCEDKDLMSKILESKGYLPMSSQYEGSTISIDQETIETNPLKYIITECLLPCEILWRKNIFTFMTSGYNENSVYVKINLEDLDERNQEVISNLKEPYFKEISNHNIITIGVLEVGESAKEKMIALANSFYMQDIPEKKGYISLQDALLLCGCSRRIKNPNYFPGSKQIKKTKLIFDPTKVNNSPEEILSKHGFILDMAGNRVFRNNFYLLKHLKFCQEEARIKATQYQRQNILKRQEILYK